MTDLQQQTLRYVQATLGGVAEPRPRDVSDRVPAFLTARYRFAEVQLRDAPVLLMLDDRDQPEPPAAIRKHVEQVRARVGLPTIYVQPWITSHRRARLIEHGVPFVVPGNQMFLPDLGIDLRERFRTPKRPRQRMRPATQALWLHLLLARRREPVTASLLVPEIGYTAMTLGRAFDELETLGLVRCESRGRERFLLMPTERRAAWEGSLEKLADPVQSRHCLQRPLEAGHLRAGLDALASLSRLVPPETATLAVGRAGWNSIQQEHADLILPEPDVDSVELQVWRYAPRAHPDAGVVEPLSLYLSLRETSDERVEQALDEMLDGLSW